MFWYPGRCCEAEKGKRKAEADGETVISCGRDAEKIVHILYLGALKEALIQGVDLEYHPSLIICQEGILLTLIWGTRGELAEVLNVLHISAIGDFTRALGRARSEADGRERAVSVQIVSVLGSKTRPFLALKDAAQRHFFSTCLLEISP